MASSPSSLPGPVLEALRRGDTAEAVKLMRGIGGAGLREAKTIIDAHQHRQSMRAPPPAAKPLAGPVFSSGLPPLVVDALQRGEKIQAIRLMREITGVGLKAAKDTIDASPLAVARSNLSPGEVPRTGRTVWAVVAAILVVWLAYSMLRGPG